MSRHPSAHSFRIDVAPSESGKKGRSTPVRARRLAGAGALSAGILALALAGAYAQDAPVRPVIHSAPDNVGFGKAVLIRGRLRNGAVGDEVVLQRRTQSGSWRDVRTGTADDELRVQFRLKKVKRSARYRLAHSAPGGVLSGSTTFSASDGVRVRVAAKLTVRVRPARAMLGRSIRVSGQLRPHEGGRRVTIKSRAGDSWRTVARPRVKDGRYSTRFSPSGSSRSRIKVVFRGDAINTRSVRKHKLVVYEPDLTSWYGPGLYGNRTACGQTLGYDTIGVAHRTLPCGTKVGFFYKGRSITVRVIDRGPYGAAEWDLTRGAAARLNFSGHGTVGTVH